MTKPTWGGMNVSVWDVNEHVQALIRERKPAEAAALADPGTPLDPLAGQSTAGS
jgi:3-phenylpropionate/trans-cinnamate dioxygenase ferredoxin reductase component